MCGRFAFYSPAEAVTRLFDVAEVAELEPRFNIAPTQYVPVVREDKAGKRRLDLLRWGLVPFWAKDMAIGNRMINARAETVAEKPAYRDAFRRRRCIVPANGFYEWQKRGSEKQPYFISLGGEQVFGMAGLWSSWRPKDKPDQRLESFTIVTTGPSDKVRDLHDRMPVILAPGDYARWLDPAADPEQLLSLLRPFDAPELVTWPVSRAVGDARNEDPGLIDSISLI